MTDLSISVIIATYNSDKTLVPAVEALLESDYNGDFEIIIIDDAGEKNTADCIPKDHRIKVKKNPHNRGPAYSRNYGAQISSGEILFFVDADVYVRKNALSVINSVFKETDLDAIVGIYDSDSPYQDFFSNYYNARVRKANIDQGTDFCHTAAYAIKKDVFATMGGFNTKYRKPSVEDLEFGVRFSSQGYKSGNHEKLVVTHDKRMTFGSLLRNDFSRAAERTEFILGSTVIKTLAAKRRFDQYNIEQMIPLLLLPLLWAGIVIAMYDIRYWVSAPFFILLFIILNRRQLFYAYPRRGLRFYFKSIVFYSIDINVVFAGLTCGIITIAVSAIKRGLGFHYLPYVKYLFVKNAPVETTFFITNKCNASCQYCFYSHQLNKPNEELSLPEIGKLFSSFGPLLRVLISGGEPFLRDDLSQIVREICVHSNPRHITIPTNGIMTGKIISAAEELLSWSSDTIINISISLSGLGSDRDLLMGVDGSFDKTVETFHALKKLKLRFSRLIVGVIVTHTSSNQRQLEKIYDFAKNELEADNIALSLVRNAPSPQEEMVDITLYKFLAHKISSDQFRGRFPFWRIFLSRRNLVYDYVARSYEGKKCILPCYSGKLRLVISPEGEVYPCETLMLREGQRFKLGNIRTHDCDIKKVYNSEKGKEVRKYIEESNCFCRHECDLFTNIAFNPRFLIEHRRKSDGI
jgi:radical SAM protein with 4Fe4S-binding SPASM domain